MAGLFRAPKPVVVPPQPAAAPAAPAPEPAQAAAEATRIAGRTAARQGIAGTIATSARGVLAPLPVTLTRKSLLGE